MKSGTKVIQKETNLKLVSVKFVVSDKTRKRVKETGRKTPHAYVEGLVFGAVAEPLPEFAKPFRYNPYQCEGFECGGKVITKGEYVWLSVDSEGRPSCYVLGPK